MEKTPLSNRRTVGIFGDVNSGKSSLFNAILGTETAIVSEVEGTTTDPVIKAMELIPFGPITMMDTAGINDTTVNAALRIKATLKALKRADFAIYTAEYGRFDESQYEQMKQHFDKYGIPHILVFTKAESLSEKDKAAINEQYGGVVFTDINDKKSIDNIKAILNDRLSKLKDREQSQLGGIIGKNDTVIMVCPIDDSAPAGRLILPQVQLIRDCLDHNAKCIVVLPSELSSAISESAKVDLVVTDSQAFKEVAEIVPPEMPLTSFSIISARQKGDLKPFIDGAAIIKSLKDGDKVLIAEACTHSKTHEDIGTVKIPKILKKISGAELEIIFSGGQDYPENLEDFSLIVHCGACMLTRKSMQNRMLEAELKGVPITNYGIVLALANGILERSLEIFLK